MKITYATDILKGEVIHVWRECFPQDSEEFISFYFREKYKNEHTLVLLEDKKVVATLQMLPYQMTYYDIEISTAYISGAATLPQFQGKGYMKKLLCRAFEEMKKKNIALSTLIPQEGWLIRFYAKLSYTKAFEYAQETIKEITDDASYKGNVFSLFDLENMQMVAYEFFNNHFRKQPFCIQKTYEDFSVILDEYKLLGGDVLFIFENQKITALCFLMKQEKEIEIKDLIAENLTAKNSLLSFVQHRYSGKKITLIKPTDASSNNCFKGMARIIHPIELLQKYAEFHPKQELSFTIKDNCIAENNRAVFIANGKCKSSENIVVSEKSEIDISLLTQLLLGYNINSLSGKYNYFDTHFPYMSLMLE